MLGAGGLFVGYPGTASIITALQCLAPVRYLKLCGAAGYGDVIPVTHFERVYIILATVVGGGLYAYLV